MSLSPRHPPRTHLLYNETMKRISLRTPTPLSSVLRKSHDFILIGEMHGAKQNGPFVQRCLRAILAGSRPCTAAFEWELSDAQRNALRRYVYGGSVPSQLTTFFLHSDGRFTYEHIALLKWIRGYNRAHHNRIDVHTFDNVLGSKDHERKMADSLCRYKKRNPRSTILVETGNIHARYVVNTKNHISRTSMASLLKKKFSVFSMLLSYQQGKIDVNGKSRAVRQACSQREDPDIFYDIVITIPRADPSRNPRSLTEIARLLS